MGFRIKKPVLEQKKLWKITWRSPAVVLQSNGEFQMLPRAYGEGGFLCPSASACSSRESFLLLEDVCIQSIDKSCNSVSFWSTKATRCRAGIVQPAWLSWKKTKQVSRKLCVEKIRSVNKIIAWKKLWGSIFLHHKIFFLNLPTLQYFLFSIFISFIMLLSWKTSLVELMCARKNIRLRW